MPSPYLGMDPYLEGYLWPDVHHRLATQISDQLTPQLRPRYVARIAIQVVVDDDPQGEEVRLSTVEIYDTAQNQLVTSIEILSPVNKRGPGLAKYREKWQRLRRAHINLIEIDLLRRGQRALSHPNIPESLWRVSLLRAGSSQFNVWTLDLPDPLPVVPIPLRKPDADVTLDLSEALRTIYERGAYDLSIDYADIPPPPALPDNATSEIQVS